MAHTIWTRSTEDAFWYALGSVPPTYRAYGGFISGEPYDHDAQGQPRFHAYMERPEGVFWKSTAPVTLAEFKTTVMAYIGEDSE